MSVELPFHCLNDKLGNHEHLIVFVGNRERLACACGQNIVSKRRDMVKISESKFSCRECERIAQGLRDFWKSRETFAAEQGGNESE